MATVWPSRRKSATRVVIAVFGALAAFAGVEHGVGELLQGAVAPPSLMIESWPDVQAFDVLAGEPAMTVVPNLAMTGVLAIAAALALGVWAVWFVQRPRGGVVLIALSMVLLLVGGGFGPPLMGVILGLAATRTVRERRKASGRVRRMLATMWSWALGTGALGYLALVPGIVILSQLTGFGDSTVVLALSAFSFGALILSLVAGGAYDSLPSEASMGES